MVIWLIGMSGVGKTVIGKEVYKSLKARRPNVVFLDGDSVREIMGNDVGTQSKTAGRTPGASPGYAGIWIARESMSYVLSCPYSTSPRGGTGSRFPGT